MAKFEEVLDECIERLLRGESFEDCLRRHPEHAEQLEPLLRTAAMARKATGSVEARPEFKARLRYEIASRARPETQPASLKGGFLGWAPRWAVAIVSICLLLVLAGGSTVAAASSSVPGDALYSVKTASERVWLTATLSGGAKARLQARLAQRRVQEMTRLIERGQTDKLGALSAKLNAHLVDLSELATAIREADPESPQIVELEEMLRRNMARGLALLEAAEANSVPESWSAVELARERLANSYQGTFDALTGKQGNESSGSGDESGSGGTDGPGNGSGGYGSMPGANPH